MFENLFKNSKNLDKIEKLVHDHKNKVDTVLKEIQLGKSFKEKYIDVLLEISKSPKIYIWKKNENHLYNFVNVFYCVNFLGIRSKSMSKIIGLSDKEIFTKQKGKNFLYKICFLTDEYMKKERKECNFVEGNFKEKVLRVKKIPIIENDKFVGSLGIAQEYEDKNLASIFLDKMIKKYNAKPLYGDLDKTFCYQIFDPRMHNNVFF